MKKLMFLLAVTSAFTAFSSTQAQSSLTTSDGSVTPASGAWLISSIRPPAEIPRVTWSNGQFIPADQQFPSNTFDIVNHGGFLTTTLNTGRPSNVDSFTYVYQNSKTTGDNAFRVRLTSIYGEENHDEKLVDGRTVIVSDVENGKVGLMLRSTLEVSSPYVMMALTNGYGPQFSWRENSGGVAKASIRSNQPRHAVAHLRLTRTGNKVTGDVSYDGTKTWVSFGTAPFPAGACYVGFASAANTSANSRTGDKDPSGKNVFKQWQLGELDYFWKQK